MYKHRVGINSVVVQHSVVKAEAILIRYSQHMISLRNIEKITFHIVFLYYCPLHGGTSNMVICVACFGVSFLTVFTFYVSGRF